jgi:hypothetical protein
MHGSVILCCNFNWLIKCFENVSIQLSGESIFTYIALVSSMHLFTLSSSVIKLSHVTTITANNQPTMAGTMVAVRKMTTQNKQFDRKQYTFLSSKGDQTKQM